MNTELGLQVDTLRELQSTAREATNPANKLALVPIPKHPTGNYITVDANGNWEEVLFPLPPREARLCSVDQAGVFARHARDTWNAHPAIYYTSEGVSIRLDDGRYDLERGMATVSLETTPVWDLLTKWDADPDQAWRGHKLFIRLLRTTFQACFEADYLKALCDSIGQLDFVLGERTQSIATRHNESMGHEVRREVRSAKGDIPEEVLLNVRIYKDPALLHRHAIRCLLESDPASGRLALIPIAEQLELAMDREMGALGDLLRSSVRTLPRLCGPADPMTERDDPTSIDEQWVIPVFYGAQ